MSNILPISDELRMTGYVLKAEEWFGRGDQFIGGAIILADHSRTNTAVLMAHIMCLGFSSEAYLKALLTLRTQRAPQDQDIRKLFNLLPTEDRQAIEAAWKPATLPHRDESSSTSAQDQTISERLEDALGALGGGLIEWRDTRTEAAAFSCSLLADFPGTVRDRILKLKPEWRKSPPGAFMIP